MKFQTAFIGMVFLILMSASVNAGIYYGSPVYGPSSPSTLVPLVPAVPSYYQPVNHYFDPSYALAQPYYVPYPVYIGAPAQPSQTIAVTSGVTYAKPQKKGNKKVVIKTHAHHSHDDFFDDVEDHFEDGWDFIEDHADKKVSKVKHFLNDLFD